MLDFLVAILLMMVVFLVGAGLTHFFADWRAREKILNDRFPTSGSVIGGRRRVLVWSLLGGVLAVLLLLFFMYGLPRELGIGILLFLIGVALVWVIILLLPKPVERVSARKFDYSQIAAYRKLLSKVLGNHDTADRLIEYERKKSPGASNDELCQNALDQWIRDNQ